MENDLKELEKRIRTEHPDWNFEKVEWIAKRALGIINI